MKLHEDKILFADIIARAAEHPSQGGLGIPPQFIEKDYWITNALQNLAESQYGELAVFKGGTSLSKAYHIGMRFSEDIDIAIIDREKFSDAKLKTIIRATEKAISKDQMCLRIDTASNPFPYHKMQIRSFVYDFLTMVIRHDLIKEFGLSPFEINVLDKRTTMTEKLVALVRFSLAQNPIPELEAKIRHFYDLYYLMEDAECVEYLHSGEFKKNFAALLQHDKELFDHPLGWRNKPFYESPLLTDFKAVWKELSPRYAAELPSLSYSLTIPTPSQLQTTLTPLLRHLGSIFC
ncbi:MAG: nucleotidyl transferase AbiEii/AbiGii toxin family protein [Muribaculaceae bacterium]|nr:nucleotidyl transferase AbiEii/AbiGii toxin family protein [Muribaculaceae bacterium]